MIHPDCLIPTPNCWPACFNNKKALDETMNKSRLKYTNLTLTSICQNRDESRHLRVSVSDPDIKVSVDKR